MKEKLFNRNFTLLLLGQVFSLIGNYTLKFALSMYVLEQTGSASIFAGLLAVATVPQVLLAPIGGLLADRLNRRNMMVALDAFSGTAVFLTLLGICGFHGTSGFHGCRQLPVFLHSCHPVSAACTNGQGEDGGAQDQPFLLHTSLHFFS